MVLNELNKIDKFGFEFGLIQQTIWYDLESQQLIYLVLILDYQKEYMMKNHTS